MDTTQELKDLFVKLDKKVSESLVEFNAKFEIIHQDITHRSDKNTASIDNIVKRIEKLEKDLFEEQKVTVEIKTTASNIKYLVVIGGFIISLVNLGISLVFKFLV